MEERPKKPTADSSRGKGHTVRDDTRAEHGPEIDSELQTHIGRHLKASYDDILGQDVPDRFLELLSKLEAKEAEGPGPTGSKQ